MPSSIEITEADVASVATEFRCDFSSDSRREVLRCTTKRDVQAGPGSGKTTLLVAKLAVLASKWVWRSQGICVLSHTNVARQEVEDRLAGHPTGHRLLGYPHFIGTIQAFVDQFLALPYLRSEGIEVSRIDNEWFGARAVSMGERNGYVRSLMKWRGFTGGPAVASLRFEGRDLKLGSAEGKIPGDKSPTHAALEGIKSRLLQDGVFRYDDMYAFATAYIAECPSIVDSLRFRFPWVFIDEMQDTSPLQDELTERLFTEGCILQRLGDINQAIFGDDGIDQGPLTFPRAGHIEVADSRRFGQEIASFASSLTATAPQELVGDGGVASHRHTIIVFDDDSVLQVLPAFGDVIQGEYPGGVPDGFVAKAVGFRKKLAEAGEKHRPPHSISDYWTGFQPDFVTKSARPHRFVDYVRRAQDACEVSGECAESHALLMDGILQLLLVQSARDEDGKQFTARRLADSLRQGDTLGRFQVLLLNLCLSRESVSSALWPSIRDNLLETLGQLIIGEPSPAARGFLEWVDRSSDGGADAGERAAARRNVFLHKGLEIEVTTIHGVKGKTHTATLVLETLWKKHDIGEMLPYLKGGRGSENLGSERSARMKRVFVGMTRPRELLCLAVRGDHLEPGDTEVLKAQGWRICDLRDR